MSTTCCVIIFLCCCELKYSNIFCLCMLIMTTKGNVLCLFVIRRSNYNMMFCRFLIFWYNAVENIPEHKWKGTEMSELLTMWWTNLLIIREFFWDVFLEWCWLLVFDHKMKIFQSCQKQKTQKPLHGWWANKWQTVFLLFLLLHYLRSCISITVFSFFWVHGGTTS